MPLFPMGIPDGWNESVANVPSNGQRVNELSSQPHAAFPQQQGGQFLHQNASDVQAQDPRLQREFTILQRVTYWN